LHRTIITEVSQQEETPTGLYNNGQNWLMPMLHGTEILTPCDGTRASFRAKGLNISACEAIMSETMRYHLQTTNVFNKYWKTWHCECHSTKIPVYEPDHHTCTETKLHHNINRENGLSFSRSEKPLIHSLKKWKKTLL